MAKQTKKTTKKNVRALAQAMAAQTTKEPEFEELAPKDVKAAQEKVAEAALPVVEEKAAKAAKEAVGKKHGPLTMEDVMAASSAAARAAVQEMMPALGSAIIQANVPKVAGAVAQVPGNYRPPLRRCYLCQQDERVCGAKQENHVKMVVGPRHYPEFGKWFRGAGINGVWYRSDHPNHKIVVPKAAVGSILAQVEAFEDDERATSHRRSGGTELGQLNDPEFGGKRVKQATKAEGWR